MFISFHPFHNPFDLAKRFYFFLWVFLWQAPGLVPVYNSLDEVFLDGLSVFPPKGPTVVGKDKFSAELLRSSPLTPLPPAFGQTTNDHTRSSLSFRGPILTKPPLLNYTPSYSTRVSLRTSTIDARPFPRIHLFFSPLTPHRPSRHNCAIASEA